MSLNKYKSIKILILKKDEYPTWKAKMLMHLEATDPDYLDVINDGPYMPTKLVPATPTIAEHYQLKEKSEVITYKTAKEFWDALETQCQGTMVIKKNIRAILIQEYEHFEAKLDESLTDIYDRFLTLLNNLSLVGKVYDREDSNTKFLRDLNEEWETQTSIILYQYDLEIITLDEVYGMLRTHDLEVQQRKERKSNKGKSVALKVNAKNSKDRSIEAARKKNNLLESDTDDLSSNPDDDTDSETDENVTNFDVMQMATLLVKGFKMIQFRKSQKKRSFKKKFTGGSDKPGHFAKKCKKTKHDKRKNKALITSSKDWMDSTVSENEETCYALMASFDAPAASDSNISNSFFSFDTEDISELKSILKSLHGNFKNKILENNRLLTENEILKSRNDQLESDLVNQIEIQKECEKAKHTTKILEAKYSMLENELENERKTLKSWTASGKKVHEMIPKKNWKECLGYVDEVKDVDSKNKTTLKTLVKFISSEADEPKSIFEKGSTSSSQEKSVSDKSQRKENKETIKTFKKEKNIGLLSKR
ncbi:hypothetical protein AgCh_022164 [Apium graveolens]